MSDRLRRWTRNPLGSARRGSNPLGVGIALVRLLRGALRRGTCAPARRAAHRPFSLLQALAPRGRPPAQKKQKLTAPWGLPRRSPTLVLIGHCAASRRRSEGAPCIRRRTAVSEAYLDLFVLFSWGCIFLCLPLCFFRGGTLVLLGFARRGSHSLDVGIALVRLRRGALGRSVWAPAWHAARPQPPAPRPSGRPLAGHLGTSVARSLVAQPPARLPLIALWRGSRATRHCVRAAKEVD